MPDEDRVAEDQRVLRPAAEYGVLHDQDVLTEHQRTVAAVEDRPVE